MERLQRTRRRQRAKLLQLEWKHRVRVVAREQRPLPHLTQYTQKLEGQKTLPTRFKLSGGSIRRNILATGAQKKKSSTRYSCIAAEGLHCGSQTPPPTPPTAGAVATINQEALSEKIRKLYGPNGLGRGVTSKFPTLPQICWSINR
ncbi:ORF3 [torque teno Delphinidae virus 56]